MDAGTADPVVKAVKGETHHHQAEAGPAVKNVAESHGNHVGIGVNQGHQPPGAQDEQQAGDGPHNQRKIVGAAQGLAGLPGAALTLPAGNNRLDPRLYGVQGVADGKSEHAGQTHGRHRRGSQAPHHGDVNETHQGLGEAG